MDKSAAMTYLKTAQHFAGTFDSGSVNPFAVQKLKAALKGLENTIFPVVEKKKPAQSGKTKKRVSPKR